MNSLTQLEYDRIKILVADLCHSSLGKQMAMALQPLENKTVIESELNLISEIQNLLKSGISFNFSRIGKVDQLLFNLQHQTYNFEEFQQFYFNLVAANSIFCPAENQSDAPLFCELISKIVQLPELENRFTEIFDADGLVNDNASSQLRRIRQQKRKLRQNIVGVLNQKLTEYDAQNFVHDKIVTQRDGRFVIPLKENSLSFIPGIVHSRSGSRNSVYIEPQEVVGINNDIELASNEEKQEIFRIFSEYTAQLREQKQEICENTKLLQSLDFHFAAADFANAISAEKPQICEQPVISLRQARHPLLIHSLGSINRVIPFDLELGTEFRILLISGPNTGGKTVTLKSIGLLALMALSGLPIPARFDSKVGMFGHIFADIGDNQSLENALSTFSSHIKNIDSMIKNGNANSLVLIDEIGAATDPEQGSALAQSILEKLTAMNCLGVITTHYTALKIFAENNENCMNAAMQFDAAKHLPTYKFKLGLPGNSFAIEVAARLGLDEELIGRARQLAGNQNVEMTDLLTKMTEEKQALSRQLYQYQLKTALLNQKIEEHQQKTDELEQTSKEIKRKSMQDARHFLTSLQKELNREIDEIKKSDRKNRKEMLEKSLQEVTSRNHNLKKQEDSLQDFERARIENPQIGQPVWLEDMETEAEIVEVSDNSVKVDMGGIFFQTSRQNLFEIKKKKVAKPKTKRIAVPKAEVKLELKILGDTFDEAVPKIDTFLDNGMMNGLGKLRIVHGKGTGALRKKVRQYLRSKNKVVDFFSPPPEAGGDGVTVVVLEKE
ncbi:MAG TPA: endonuclease MutS2 [Candidatus Cloacimonadota bacterium]|nr:endonuclease MutS2 [Candidatus Cloacimonadota bacterium]